MTLARLARELIGSRKSPHKKAPALDVALLTRTEKLRAGLPVKREKLVADGCYSWALVTFDNAFRMLVGFYPRQGEEREVTAMRYARSRYLLILSGGRLIDADKAGALPSIASVTPLSDHAAIVNTRRECGRIRDALEAFTGHQWTNRERDAAMLAHLRGLS